MLLERLLKIRNKYDWKPEPFSEEFKAIFRGLACGFSNDQIAKKMGLSPVTIKKKISKFNLPLLIERLFGVKNFDWVQFPSLLEKHGYLNSAYEEEVKKRSQVPELKAYEIIHLLQKNEVDGIITDKSNSDLEDLIKEADALSCKGNDAGALLKYNEALDGDITSVFAQSILVRIIGCYEKLLAYEDCIFAASFFLDYIKEPSAKSSAYGYLASVYHDLCLKNCDRLIFLQARRGYKDALAYNPYYPHPAWNVVDLTIDFSQLDILNSQRSLEYQIWARKDFATFKKIIEQRQNLPEDILQDMKNSLPKVKDERLKREIISLI